jgi:hypothetical protein
MSHISGADESSSCSVLVRPIIYGPGLHDPSLSGPRFLEAAVVLAR